MVPSTEPVALWAAAGAGLARIAPPARTRVKRTADRERAAGMTAFRKYSSGTHPRDGTVTAWAGRREPAPGAPLRADSGIDEPKKYKRCVVSLPGFVMFA